MEQRQYLYGMLMVIASAVCFSVQPVFASYAYADGASVSGLMWLRFLVPSLLLVLLVKRPDGFRVLHAIAMGVLYSATAICYYSALQHVSAGVTAMLLYLFPVYIFLVAALLRQEKVTLVKMLALLAAMCGVFLSIQGGSEGSVTGIVWGLGSAVCYGTYIMLSTKVLGDKAGLAATGYIMIGCALVFSVPVVLGEASLPQTVNGYVAALALGLISSVAAMYLLMKGVTKMGRATDASIVSTFEPVATLFFAWLLLAEPLSAANLIGAGLVVAAAITLALSSARQRAKESALAAQPQPVAG